MSPRTHHLWKLGALWTAALAAAGTLSIGGLRYVGRIVTSAVAVEAVAAAYVRADTFTAFQRRYTTKSATDSLVHYYEQRELRAWTARVDTTLREIRACQRRPKECDR